LCVYALGVNHDIRLVAPLMPLLALVLARLAASLTRPSMRVAGYSLLISCGLWTCLDQTLLAGPERALAYNGAASDEAGWDREKIIDAALLAAGPQGVVAVALEHAQLNANNLSCLAATKSLDLHFVSLGYAQTSLEAALIRLKEKNAHGLILVEGAESKNLPVFLNRINADISMTVRSGRLPSTDMGQVTLEPGITARILRLL
jgi:hypothetical protein